VSFVEAVPSGHHAAYQPERLSEATIGRLSASVTTTRATPGPARPTIADIVATSLLFDDELTSSMAPGSSGWNGRPDVDPAPCGVALPDGPTSTKQSFSVSGPR